MAFEPNGLLLLLHVVFASLWFGGGIYQVVVIGPTMAAAGPQGAGFALALAKRGGIGKYFAIAGALTILFGGLAYWRFKVYDYPSEQAMWLNAGAGLAVLAYLHGAAINMPTEKKWLALANGLRGPPTPDEARRMQELGTKMGRNGVVSLVMIAVALVAMLLPRVLT